MPLALTQATKTRKIGMFLLRFRLQHRSGRNENWAARDILAFAKYNSSILCWQRVFKPAILRSHWAWPWEDDSHTESPKQSNELGSALQTVDTEPVGKSTVFGQILIDALLKRRSHPHMVTPLGAVRGRHYQDARPLRRRVRDGAGWVQLKP